MEIYFYLTVRLKIISNFNYLTNNSIFFFINNSAFFTKFKTNFKIKLFTDTPLETSGIFKMAKNNSVKLDD